MDEELTHELGTKTPATRGLDRRQLLKAGAWATPAVVLAAATPAASASGIINLKFTHLSAWYAWTGGSKTGLTGTTAVQTTGDPGASTTDVTVVVTTSAAGLSTTAEIVEGSDSRWIVAGTGATDGQGSIAYTFRWTGTLQIDQNTGELKFNLVGDGDGLNDTPVKQITASAISEGAVGDTTTASAVRFENADEPLPVTPPL